MMERLILSVDGGGSKTCFLAAAPDGSPRYHAEAGATSHKSVGRRKASANLHEGLCALKQQGLDRKSLMVSVFEMCIRDSYKVPQNPSRQIPGKLLQ